MLKCQNCKGEVLEGSPELKICPFCGEAQLVHVEVKKDEKKTPSEKMGKDRGSSFIKEEKAPGQDQTQEEETKKT